MTQEELDALMSGGLDEMDETDLQDEQVEELDDEGSFVANDADKPVGYSNQTAHHWPLPATQENKMVHQLDDVTKESEEKATQIFDIVEQISNDMMEKEAVVESLAQVVGKNIELFEKLSVRFPDIKAFGEQLELNKEAKQSCSELVEMCQTNGDALMSVMDIMQYQDIHRQKIERVINVMRALSNYLNSLFEARIDDSKRVSSAQHIVGDTHNETVSEDDIEALLAQFAKK
ncbi:MAG: chemotaxis protein [Sulfuricurvum sp.]